MPPKRDKGKGKGKKKEILVEDEPFNPCDVEPKELDARSQPVEKLNEATIEMFLLQIGNCQEKLEIYQRKADELAVKTQFYPELYDQLDLDTKDLSSYLNWCLQEKESALQDVKTKYEDRKTVKQEQHDDQQKQLEDAQIQIKETRQQMSDQNDAIRVQLVAMKPVEEDWMEVSTEIARLIQEYSVREALNKEKTYQQQRNATMEVERLRRDATARIGTVAEECKAFAEKKLEATVKQCMIESDRAATTIASKYSDETISGLLRENDKLRRRTEENQRLIEILEANRTALEHENQQQCEVVEALVQKSKGYEPLDLDFRYQQTDRDILRPLAFLKAAVDEERKLLVNATERRQTLQKSLEKTDAAVKSTSAANKDLYDTLMAASPGLQQILPASEANLLKKLETLASDDAFKHVEPSEAPPPRRQRVRLLKRRTPQQNCIAKPT